MTAVNAGIHELTGLRLPLHPYSGGHAVFMYSTAADGNVTLQLKEPDDLDRGSLAAMLARLQDDATFSISYQDTDILSDGSIDVLLGSGTANQASGENDVVNGAFDLFDSSSGPDLTLSPQTFTNSAEAFINDNSNSLGVSADTDPAPTSTTSTTDEKKPQSDVVKLTVKRPRPKAASPNRQGPQQCQVCAKVFGNASALAKHKLTHSDERKYVCTMCGKAFKRQDHLNGHMLTHRNKKPYECKAEGCGKSYCDARSLRRHTENHHSSNTTTMSPAQGAASGDAASPHGSSCIQYAPAPSSGNKSQLQQLLATEPAKGGNGGSNDGLTKQQLDLIHQIMEQTQRQSQSASKATTKPTAKPISKTPVKVQRIWTSTTASSKPTTSPQSKVTTTTPSTPSPPTTTTPTTSPKTQPQPTTEPKPVECNLCHRKFKNVPALNGHMRLHGGYFKKDADNKKLDKKDANNPPLQTASVSVRALIEEKIINKRITAAPALPSPADEKADGPKSFAVPAPLAPPSDKLQRRHSSDAAATQQKAEALAELILKRADSAKHIKRTASDPGQVLQFPADGYALAYQPHAELAASLESEALLQNINDLTAIQFGTGALDEYATAGAYAAPVNQELQAVLNSPLPESLAEFSTFHSPATYTEKMYASPLQSPLNGSPGLFAYPTPPASHEGQSPCFGPVSHQVLDRGLEEPPQASSPLSAAFFTSTMSSSEAVEEALEEVLPGESDIYPLASPQSLTPVSSPPLVVAATSDAFNQNYQSQMLPNSDDPLLSSSPRDFGRKKFELNGVPFRVVNSNLVDLSSGNLTGILLDANGEIKLIQTNGGGAFQGKNFILANGLQMTDGEGMRFQKVLKTVQVQQKARSKVDDVFLSPRTVPPAASPVKGSRKRQRTEPLSNRVQFQSKLRRHHEGFTPLPMLNPARNGTGLFRGGCDDLREDEVQARVNIGEEYQCKIPTFCEGNDEGGDAIHEDLLWDPGILKCSALEVDMYLDFACCSAVPGGGRNKEYALHLLHMCGGNIYDALLRLMQPLPMLPSDHPLLTYQYNETEKWTQHESEQFQKLMLKHDKDFASISQEIGTKTLKQCIQFYYVWKKFCCDEYKKVKWLREKRHQFLTKHCEDGDDNNKVLFADAKLLGLLEANPAQDIRSFTCEFTDCSASFNSRAALNGHIRIHGGTMARHSPTPSTVRQQQSPIANQVCHIDSTEDYPCKVCGKVFTKIKSRSAHMKSHRPPDADPPLRRTSTKEISTLSSIFTTNNNNNNTTYELSVPSPLDLQ